MGPPTDRQLTSREVHDWCDRQLKLDREYEKKLKEQDNE